MVQYSREYLTKMGSPRQLSRDDKKIEYVLHNDEIQIPDTEYEAIQRNLIELTRSLRHYYIKRKGGS
jgi:hypothetical protein